MINEVLSDVCLALNENKFVGACLIDIKKAFDTVWLNGLFFQLKKKNFSLHLIRILWAMVHEKTFRVVHCNVILSIRFKIEDGLQQGTVNSPI